MVPIGKTTRVLILPGFPLLTNIPHKNEVYRAIVNTEDGHYFTLKLKSEVGYILTITVSSEELDKYFLFQENHPGLSLFLP